MKLTPPFPTSTIVQHFGQNAVTLYQQGLGLKGHPGTDFGEPWGTPIPNAIDGAVVSCILNRDNPNLMAFRAVNTIYEDATGCYEIQYGHCSTISVDVGQTLKQGDIVGEIGNTGDVFVGGREVTQAEKDAGSHAGAHLHFQVRVIQKEPVGTPLNPEHHYLNDGSTILTLNGFHYWTPNYANGYNGCVDPELYFSDLAQTIKDEIQVVQNQTDPSVRQSFFKLIAQQAAKLLGF